MKEFYVECSECGLKGQVFWSYLSAEKFCEQHAKEFSSHTISIVNAECCVIATLHPKARPDEIAFAE